MNEPSAANVEKSKCKTCGRAIIWTKSPTGALLPLDARPVTVYTLGWTTDTLSATPLQREPGAEPMYVSHFLTCPQAAQHSHRGKP